jgi:hypothetical protein
MKRRSSIAGWLTTVGLVIASVPTAAQRVMSRRQVCRARQMENLTSLRRHHACLTALRTYPAFGN